MSASAKFWEDLNCDGVKDADELVTIRNGADMDLDGDGFVTADERFGYEHMGEIDPATGQKYTSFPDFVLKAKSLFDNVDSYVTDGTVSTYHMRHFELQDTEDKKAQSEECSRLVNDLSASNLILSMDDTVHRTQTLYTPKSQCFVYRCADGEDTTTKSWFIRFPQRQASTRCECSRACDDENRYRSNVGLPRICIAPDWNESTSECILNMRATCQPDSLFESSGGGSVPPCACRTFVKSHQGPCSSTTPPGVTQFESQCVAAIQEGASIIANSTVAQDMKHYEVFGNAPPPTVAHVSSSSSRTWRVVFWLAVSILTFVGMIRLVFLYIQHSRRSNVTPV